MALCTPVCYEYGPLTSPQTNWLSSSSPLHEGATSRHPLLGPGGIGKLSVTVATINDIPIRYMYERDITFVSCRLALRRDHYPAPYRSPRCPTRLRGARGGHLPSITEDLPLEFESGMEFERSSRCGRPDAQLSHWPMLPSWSSGHAALYCPAVSTGSSPVLGLSNPWRSTPSIRCGSTSPAQHIVAKQAARSAGPVLATSLGMY
ncbi:hypothetical protein CALCODRAFT_330952 [Calocera cornea HHB12733]|uniref:Uncharacterized protein n=1 Tax=Calocera cornea HHB12733 TaxID=1353952 RepID=A0A165F2E7_9BASI|nr:hypothetical protein CALCODRAFT_330952 [Calocera cornea HHB12733]